MNFDNINQIEPLDEIKQLHDHLDECIKETSLDQEWSVYLPKIAHIQTGCISCIKLLYDSVKIINAHSTAFDYKMSQNYHSLVYFGIISVVYTARIHTIIDSCYIALEVSKEHRRILQRRLTCEYNISLNLRKLNNVSDILKITPSEFIKTMRCSFDIMTPLTLTKQMKEFLQYFVDNPTHPLVDTLAEVLFDETSSAYSFETGNWYITYDNNCIFPKGVLRNQY